MPHTARVLAFVLAMSAALAACGSRVVPLTQAQGFANPTVNPTGGPIVNPTGGPLTGPTGTSTLGPNPSGGPTAGPSPLLPNCRGGSSDTGVTKSTIKLGLVASKTGPLPGQFNSAIEAVDSYFRGLNDAGGICGRKVELLIRDDNGNGATDLQVAEKLATEDKIFMFVGGVSAPDDSGIAKVSKKYKIPDIGFPLTWERAESPYSYGVPGQIQRRIIGTGAAGTKYLNEANGIKQVAMFWLRESEVSVLNAYGFEASIIRASKGAIKICYEQPAGVLDNNFTNYVVSMNGACRPENGPIAVYTTMENNGNIKLAKSMMEQDFKPKVFAPTFSSYLRSFIDQAGGATEGAYMAVPQIPFERLDRPQSEWTPGTYELKRYIETLNRYYPRPASPGSFGGPGWGMAAMFTEAATACGANLTRTCILRTLDSMKQFSANGFLSPTKPSNHSVYTADLIVQVRNGKFTEIKPLDRSGPPGGPDFWDKGVLYNWQKYFCANQSKFPDAEGKKDLISEC